jgi:Flp pilus assembly protein TadG
MQHLARLLHAFTADRRGSAAVLAGIVLVSLIGMAGLTVDLGGAYVQKARLQKVADSAAMAGALSWIKSGHSASAAQATIQSVVTANGLAAGTIQNPTGAYLSQSPKNASHPAIQVQLSAALSLTLLKVITSSTTLTTSAYAAAEIGGSGAGGLPACVLSLSNIIINSNSSINGTHCSIAANGTGNQAILLNSNSALLSGDSVNTPGGVWLNSNTTLNAPYIDAGLGVTNQGGHDQVTGTINTQGVSAVSDPFSSYQSVASSGFTGCQNYSGQNPLSPGCWQNVNVNSNSSLTLKAGTFYFQGSLNLNSNSSLTGTGGVTIVVQNQFSPSSNNGITITAPSSSSAATPMPGIAIYAMGGININSNITFSINGAIYSPTAAVIMDSNTGNAGNCTYVVGQSITANSNVSLAVSNCPSGDPIPSAGGGGANSVALVR